MMQVMASTRVSAQKATVSDVHGDHPIGLVSSPRSTACGYWSTCRSANRASRSVIGPGLRRHAHSRPSVRRASLGWLGDRLHRTRKVIMWLGRT